MPLRFEPDHISMRLTPIQRARPFKIMDIAANLIDVEDMA